MLKISNFFIALAFLAFSASANAQNNTLTYDKGVIINGVKWATRNINAAGTFAPKPESAGKFYQWNRKKAWAATGETVTGWGSSEPTGNVWEKANDPSPKGWRVPTLDEFKKLLDESKVSRKWTTLNGVNGYEFTDNATGATLFLSAAGYRSYSGDGTLIGVGSYGYYWSSTQDGSDSAYCLGFYSGNAVWTNSGRRDGFCVRPVSE